MHAPAATIARPRELLLVSVAGVVLALVMTWPLAAGFGSLGRTSPIDADGQFSIWNVSWVARTLAVDPLHVFDANIFVPHRQTLAYSEANLLPGVLGMPAYWLTRNPWLTLNSVMVAAFASAFVCAYLLLRRLSGRPLAAAAGAILYAYCPYVMSHLSHIQLLFTGGIPLSLLLLHRVAEEPRTRRGVALGLALAAQALACAYYGVFAGLMVGYAALVLAGTRRLWTSTAYWGAIAAAAAISLALTMPFFLPFLDVQQETGFVRSVDDTARWAARPVDYLVSSAHAHAWLLAYARTLGPWQEVLFPGLIAVVLGLAGAAAAARRAGPDRETAVLYGTLGTLALWSSFGPRAGLYRLLYHLPAFSFLRAPSRLGLAVALCLIVLAAVALRLLIDAAPAARRSLLGGIAVAAAVAETAVLPLRWARAPVIPPGYQAFAHRQRAPLAEFPFYGDRVAFPLHAQYMLFSTAHWLPMVNGYSDVIPADFREAAPVLDSFPSDAAFAALGRRRVRYIAVHWDMYVGRREEIRRRLAPYLPDLLQLAGDDRMTLYEVLRYR